MEETVTRAEGRGVAELSDLASAGLVPMLDPDKQIFCDIYNRTGKDMVREGLSQRYTMMTLLGLRRYEMSGRRSPVAITPVLNALLNDTTWVNGAGDLGLLLWTCAELVPDQLPQVYRKVGAQGALTRFADGQQGSTMEVAWYLTGIAGCYLAGHGNLPELAAQAAAARKILEENCGACGVYRHFRRSNSLVRNFRGRIGTFADQVYPTIAFARLSQALDEQPARQMAQRTAQKMCELQAPLGEWCWHYDSKSGKVVSRYPVYSVHQHAMGPMMLFAAGEATGIDFSAAIHKGLAWIYGDNELKLDLVDTSLDLVWRCIYLDSIHAYSDAAQRVMGLRSGTAAAQNLKVRYECRPYELGWLLYAFSGRDK